MSSILLRVEADLNLSHSGVEAIGLKLQQRTGYVLLRHISQGMVVVVQLMKVGENSLVKVVENVETPELHIDPAFINVDLSSVVIIYVHWRGQGSAEATCSPNGPRAVLGDSPAGSNPFERQWREVHSKHPDGRCSGSVSGCSMYPFA